MQLFLRAIGSAVMVAMLAPYAACGAPVKHHPAASAAHRAAPKAHALPPPPPPPPAPPLSLPAPPMPAGDFTTPVAALTDQVNALLAARCPRAPLAYTTDRYGKNVYQLVSFDSEFKPDIRQPASPQALQIALEAYRQCLDRAIAAIRSSKSYVIRHPDENDCIDCAVNLSDVALQIPRLHLLKGLTYLAPPKLADQDPGRALAELRRAISDIGTIQSDFQSQADEAFEQKRDALNAKRRAAERQALARTNGAALSGLLGAGLGMAMGLNAQQSVNIASNAMQQQFTQINSDLAVQNQQIQAKRLVVDGQRQGMFTAPALGNWRDDGFRVTLPRISEIVYNKEQGNGTVAVGAMTSAFHTEYIVHLSHPAGPGMISTCTGSIVGPRLILTNRHCVATDEGNGELIQPKNFTVSWRYIGSTLTDLRQYAQVFHVVAVHTSDMAQPRGENNDWAFLETDGKIGAMGYLGIVDPADLAKAGEFRAAIAGYSGDLNKGSEITMDWGCRAQWRNGIIYDSCHTWKGSSGSPIVAVDGTFRRTMIVGVNCSVSGEVQTGSQEGMRFGTATREMYETFSALRTKQDGAGG